MKRSIDVDNYFTDLRTRMQKAGVTGAALAAEIGIGADQLSRWLSGKLDPRLSSVARIETALDIIEEGK